MDKKQYVAPEVGCMLFVPVENIAANGSWKWQWGNWNELNPEITPSVTGTQSIWLDPQEHDTTENKKPY